MLFASTCAAIMRGMHLGLHTHNVIMLVSCMWLMLWLVFYFAQVSPPCSRRGCQAFAHTTPQPNWVAQLMQCCHYAGSAMASSLCS